jgi:bifunctional non-homologous end joining protein LigD
MNQTMSALTARESVTLYFREGSSDKVYQISLEPAGEGCLVNFAYGRRGSTLSTGTKTSIPVSYDEAKLIYDRLVREKMTKGYTPGENGTAYQHSGQAERVSGLLPQLLNPVDEERMRELICDDAWGMQEKLDGRRVLLVKRDARIMGVNRKGLTIGLPESIIKAAEKIDGDFVLDGECITHLFYTFDILSLRGDDLRSLGFHQRSTALLNLLASAMQRHIHFVQTFYDVKTKERALNELRSTKREGVVFKRLDAPYTSGRPNSGGTQLKHKFYATCSAVVARVNAQRSVELRLLGGDGWRPAGNVTIPVNHRVPRLGDVVEVRYLYAFVESGALYQSVYLGPRTDIAQHDCGVSQLKYKAGEEEA